MNASADPIDRELRDILAETEPLGQHARWRIDGALAGGFRSSHRGAGIEFDEVREYVPGDDPRSVDWNVTARVGWPFVKKYVDERELTLLLAVDVSRSMDDGPGAWSYRQVAARLAAMLGMAAASNDDAIGLLAFDDRVRAYVKPGRGRRHALRIVRDCLSPREPRATTSLSEALDWLVGVPRSRCAVLLVSDFLMRLDAPALARLARVHDVAAAHLVAADLPLPKIGLVRLSDAESGAVRVQDWSDDRERAAVEASVRDQRAEVRRNLVAAGIDVFEVESPRVPNLDALRRPLLEFLRSRS